MSKFAIRFLNDESGATAIEYGLIATMIAAVIAGVVGVVGGHVKDAFQSGADLFTDKPPAP
ncbi:fimbrial protein [Caulobacter sp. Root655]|uniref:Flp family type IVb pilin n=1 Tax=Caulobacter sp. Root655 TaxID=1736578 RepID=UPI0006F2D13C|nr:Flp family type IVb pilin [Caulobacter sp. Root655]KRA66070.1 fimbrial protein [Caulobacter sp. Root655]